MAMKYIDAEKLKAEIKRLEEMDYPCDTLEQSTGFYDALDRIKSFIAHLVEEEPKHTEVWVEGRTIFEQEGEPNKANCPFDKGNCDYCTVQFCGARENVTTITTSTSLPVVEEEPTQVEEEHPDNFTSFEWLVGRLMFRGCDLWGMTDGEDDNGIVTKLIKDRAAEMMELLERELDPNAEPVDLEKEIDNYMDGYFSECQDGTLLNEGGSELQYEDVSKIAKYFYELGQREMRNRISNPEYNKQVVDKMKSEYPELGKKEVANENT